MSGAAEQGAVEDLASLPGAVDLLAEARRARANAYAPYSGYAVGAALEAATGRTYTGANVENAAYGVTICAERVALSRAVSDGEREFRRIAIVSEGDVPFPCGACRQALAEFSPDLEILLSGGTGLQRRFLTELLPDAFRLRRDPPLRDYAPERRA